MMVIYSLSHSLLTHYLLTQSYTGGLFSGLHHTESNVTTTPYKNWDSSVCTASPYIYIKPFAFIYSSASSLVGDSGTTLTYCGFPDSNSIFRIVITGIIALTNSFTHSFTNSLT